MWASQGYESGSLIQGTGMEEFEDGLRIGNQSEAGNKCQNQTNHFLCNLRKIIFLLEIVFLKLLK